MLFRSSAENRTDDRQAEVKRLSEEIFRLRSETDALREDVGAARVSLAARQRGLEARTAERDRLNEQANDTEKLLAESEIALAECLKELEENAALLEADIEALDGNKASLDSARAEFNTADQRRTGVQRQLQTLGEQIDALRASLDDFSDRHHRSEIQLTRVEGEYKQIQDRIWEDYELSYAGAEAFRQADFKLTESEKRIAAIRQRIRAMGTVNVAAVDEYRRTEIGRAHV